MTTLEFKWTESRGRDTYGYTICTLYVDGRKVARCNGGGYDMKGTCFGSWLASAYADRLNALKPKDMPEQSHWQRSEKPRRYCRNPACEKSKTKRGDLRRFKHDAYTCPHCGGETDVDYQDGKRIDDGRYFYGLSYHDPNYDPGKAVIGEDCDDRTFSKKSKGKTVEQAEAAGETVGLERYQAFYRASSKVPTERHTVPQIDGACGFSTVEAIARAIGITLEYVPTRKRNDTIYILHDAMASE